MNTIVLGINLTLGGSFDEVSAYRDAGYEVVQRNIVIQEGHIIAAYWLEKPLDKAHEQPQPTEHILHFSGPSSADIADGIYNAAQRSIRRRLYSLSPATAGDAAAADKLQQPSPAATDTGNTDRA